MSAATISADDCVLKQHRPQRLLPPQHFDVQEVSAYTLAVKERAFLGAMLTKSCFSASTSIHDGCSYSRSTFAALGVIGDRGRVAAERNDTIGRRLAELDSILHEDCGVGLDPSAKSAFIGFMRANPQLSVPSLTADSRGELVAVWRKGGESLSLKFFDATSFHYALAIQKDGKVVRPWGTSTAPELFVSHPETARIAA